MILIAKEDKYFPSWNVVVKELPDREFIIAYNASVNKNLYKVDL